MNLRIRSVRLRAQTPEGAFGRQVDLARGFNVVRGANSRGKTQVVQAIIYGLGLEGMLSTRSAAPLGSALTSELLVGDTEDAAATPVNSSWVAVELENSAGRVITVQRFVRHATLKQNLVRVWEGAALTDAAPPGPPVDFFLHLAGAASHERGFHRLLADVIGWTLPQVATFSGPTVTLYPDVVFPFLVVDQQSWGSAGPRKVTRYQIREPVRRSAEFLLALSGPLAEARRGQLEQAMGALRTDWAAGRSSLSTLVGTIGGRIVGVPEHAAGAQARASSPEPSRLDEAELQVLDGGEWIPAIQIRTQLVADLGTLAAVGERAITPEANERSVQELREAREELADLLAAARLVDQDLSLGEAQLAALERRVESLQEERNRNSDVRTLVRLGSESAATHLADDNCPTCRQSLEAVESDDLGPTLDVDETVTLLNAQIATAIKMRGRGLEVAEQGGNAYAALQRQADLLRVRVQALETDVLGPATQFSIGDVARRITLELRQSELLRVEESVRQRIEEMSSLAHQIAETRGELASLPVGVPDGDAELLSELVSLMRERLVSSHFGSYSVSEIGLDPDSLRPSRDGFDVDTDVSASDVVRIKIAYLDSVRVLGVRRGQHPGILILDEPRQQDIDPIDYAATLRYLSEDADVTGQVIVTSATPRGELAGLIDGIDAHLIDLGSSRLLQRESAESFLDVN